MKASNRLALAQKKYPNTKITPEMLCPKWSYCNCNKCILNKDYKKLEVKPEDKTKKCKCPKTIRKQIGEFFKLKNGGLNDREISGAKRWAELSDEERESKTKILTQNSPFVKLKTKGYGISRVKNKEGSFTRDREIKMPVNNNRDTNPNESHSLQRTIKEQSRTNDCPNNQLKNKGDDDENN